MMAEGLADIDHGDVVEGEEAFRQLRAHSAERRLQRK
jgi:predicted transcriptional regulator